METRYALPMHPATHLLTGWATATALPLSRRDRALVCLAGVIPDLDGLGIVVEKLTLHSEQPLYWYALYHHVLAHNLAFGLAVTLTAAAVARQRLRAGLLVLLSFHLHLLADLVGSGGPDGASWPLRYLWPFGDLELTWQGQWAFNAWPNFAITLALLLWMSWVAATRGHSPLELISSRADRAFCATVKRWWRR
jgi:inner membrane protein